MKKFLIIGGVILVGLLTWHLWPKAEPVQGYVQVMGPVSVVGTRVATTTTGVPFLFSSGTTTAITASTTGAELAVYTIKAVYASTTAQGGGVVSLSFFGSNDYDCGTTKTSTDGKSVVLAKDINWYDIGTHIPELAGSQSILTGTSSITWIATPGLGKDITLKDLNYECLRVDVGATSTVLFIQLKTKTTF